MRCSSFTCEGGLANIHTHIHILEVHITHTLYTLEKAKGPVKPCDSMDTAT